MQMNNRGRLIPQLICPHDDWTTTDSTVVNCIRCASSLAPVAKVCGACVWASHLAEDIGCGKCGKELLSLSDYANKIAIEEFLENQNKVAASIGPPEPTELQLAQEELKKAQREVCQLGDVFHGYISRLVCVLKSLRR